MRVGVSYVRVVLRWVVLLTITWWMPLTRLVLNFLTQGFAWAPKVGVGDIRARALPSAAMTKPIRGYVQYLVER